MSSNDIACLGRDIERRMASTISALALAGEGDTILARHARDLAGIREDIRSIVQAADRGIEPGVITPDILWPPPGPKPPHFFLPPHAARTPMVGRPAVAEAVADSPCEPRWQDRLTYDFAVSHDSPVIKGTWVTASQIVREILDGCTWSDILRTHPEITEDDVRACLIYSVEMEEQGRMSVLPDDGDSEVRAMAEAWRAPTERGA